MKYMDKILIRNILAFILISHTFGTAQAQDYNYDKGCLFGSSLFGRLGGSIPDTIMPQHFDTAYMARYSVSPSFESDYAFQLNRADSGQFQITGLYLLQHIHNYASKRDSITFEVLKKDISPNIALSLEALFTALVQQPHDYGSIGGEDGVSYYFQNKRHGIESCASTWEPDAYSPIGEVIDICNILSQYPKDETISLTGLSAKIDSLRDAIYLQNKPPIFNKIKKPDYLALFLDYPFNCMAEDNIKLFLTERVDTCLTSNTTAMATIDSLHIETYETDTTLSVQLYLKALKNQQHTYINDVFTFSKRTGEYLNHQTE